MTNKKNNYYNRIYPHLRRWNSYWYQIDEIVKLSPKNILEIGIGDRIVCNFLKAIGYNVNTLDIEKSLKPDFVASVEKIPLSDGSYDLVLAAEVLEHLPFEKIENSLKEIYRVARKNVIITLPQWGREVSFSLKIPGIRQIKFNKKIFSVKENKFNNSNGHYWEINKRGYSVKKIKNIIESCNFKILKDYIPFENYYHHFFVLEKI